MKKLRIMCLILIGVLFSLYGFSNTDPRIKMFEKMKGGSGKLEKNTVKIPFKIKSSHIMFIKVKINDQKEKQLFVFDTGGVTMLDKSYAEKCNLKIEHLFKDKFYTFTNKIKFNGAEITDYKPFVIDFRKKFRDVGKNSDTILYGMIGCDIFRFFKVTIDYQKCNIILTDSDNQLEAKGDNQALFEMNLLLPYHPCINIDFGNNFILPGRIDTGLHYAIVLPIHLIDKLNDVEKKKLIKSKGHFAQWPDTKIEYNYLYKFKKIKIGKFKLINQAVLFADLPMFADKDFTLIGKHFLENYKTEMDFKNRKVLLTKINESNNKSLLFSVGTNIIKEGDKVLIKGIWKNSPADKKGLKIGDEITNINEKSAEELNNKIIYNILMNKDITEIELKVKNKKIVLRKEILL